MTASIVLIGPGNSGKTTLSKLLGERLGWPSIDLDDVRWNYYAEIGYDHAKAEEIKQTGGMPALAAYWKPFEVYSVECFMRDYPAQHVLAFGAGQSVYDDEAMFQQVKTALAPFPHIILLLPTPDIDESVRIMDARLRAAEPEFNDDFYNAVAEINRYFAAHPSNARLATLTIYTAGKSPAESCAEIMQKLHHDAV